MNALRRQHAGLDGRMRALDLDAVEEAGAAADQHAAGKREPRQRLQTTFVDGARSIGDTLAAVEIGTNLRVQFPALKLVKRRKVRVSVVQRDDQAEKDLVVGGVIEKAPALGVVVERPSGGVYDQALLVLAQARFPRPP